MEGTQLIVGSHQSKIHKSSGKMHVSCLTDLDYCIVFVDRVGVFLENVPRTLKPSERFLTNFPVVSLYFTCFLALVASTATAGTII